MSSNPVDIDEQEGELDFYQNPSVQLKSKPKFIMSYVPRYGSLKAAGADLQADVEAPVGIKPGTFKVIPTGIYVNLPEGYEFQIRSRSGLAAKNGVFILNSPGTIDEDYHGEIMIILANLGEETFVVKPGMRIGQAILSVYTQANFEKVEEFDNQTVRGINGLGSTGV